MASGLLEQVFDKDVLGALGARLSLPPKAWLSDALCISARSNILARLATASCTDAG